MSIVSLESKDEKNISMSIAQFFAVYGIISLLRNCGGLKLKGVPVRELSPTRLRMLSAWAASICSRRLERFGRNFLKTHIIVFLRTPV
ncbi:hypothetical protein [Anaerovibrio slackiae]|uniref:hypothetical protein n=1 Tax=Anaerovibrio slackiae TaxID=2652309 RepID=UPI00386C6F3C